MQVLEEMTPKQVCAMFADPCEFCSNETSRHPCTWVKREGTVFKPIRTGFIIRELGQLCNNAPLGEEVWIEKMVRCPVRWARANKIIPKEAPKKRAYRKTLVPQPIIRKRGRPKKVVGQMTLRV